MSVRARHYRDCPTSRTHGDVAEQVLFRRRGTMTEGDGAVLSRADTFARWTLAAGERSALATHADVEEVVFVASGCGVLLAGGSERRLRDGDGVLVPPDVEHAFRADGEETLELLVVTAPVPLRTSDGRRTVAVRNHRDSDTHRGHWAHLSQRVFDRDDGLTTLHQVLVVRMEPMTVSELHGHGADMDEVWYMWRGSGVHVVGREVCVHTPGTAIQVAPSDPGHMLINHTDTPLHAFYFSCLPR
jgi:mannose-6-phosphate isomerase-like protein (cupin superfamily)